MKPFLLYTLARVGLFAAAFGLVWLVFGHWIEWGLVSGLYTAIIAMAVSSVAALFLLGPLRDDFAANVAGRADRAKAAFEARRAAEDDEPPGQPSPSGGADDAADQDPERIDQLGETGVAEHRDEPAPGHSTAHDG